VRLERGDASCVRLEISDEGPGIPVVERERVWRPYQRGGAGRQTAGSGIGLSVVHDVVMQHGGRAWVEDAPSGRGARIVVTLPTRGREASSVDEPDITENPTALAPAVHNG
jgi:two-component system, OmpR family, sensor histidine kinase RstB